MTSLVVAPAAEQGKVRGPDGALLSVPAGWSLLPPGDPGLTRRVKAAGPSWTVMEKRGRKNFSRGVWAPQEHIERARADLSVEREDPSYARKLAAAAERRQREQSQYVLEFANAVLAFLRFAPPFTMQAKRLAVIVTEHATPVGSGTVARTERIPLQERAGSAVIAWLRHATTGYDDMRIERVKGRRREVRRELAQASRTLLERHRENVPHAESNCTLCREIARRALPAAGG